MFGGTGGFAQTPDVLSRLHPGRKPVSLQRSPTRKEAVLARPTGPSARKSGSGRYPPTGAETLPATPVFRAALSLQEEAERASSARGPAPPSPGRVRGGGTRPPPHPEGAGADLRHKGGRSEERGPVGAGPWGYLRAGGQQGREGRACIPNPTPATSGTAPRARPIPPALFRTRKRPLDWDAVTQGRGAGAPG